MNRTFSPDRSPANRLAIGLFLSLLVGTNAIAADARNGAQVYQQLCASCHGEKGQGTNESYPHPLVGERSLGELTEYIDESMPEDNPDLCSAEDARLVAAYVYEAFYSPMAQARNRPARIELSRLTIRQYRNSLADLIESFRGSISPDDRQGLRGEYFKSRRFSGRDRVIERIDPVVQFDFEDRSPDAEKLEPHEFSIRWEGAVLAPDTGEYEFMVRTEHATRLWINDSRQPLLDAWVKSGSDTDHRTAIYLLGGRTYSLRLEFSKAKQGVDDKKSKEKPPAKASIALEWKRPHRVSEVIPARYLTPSRPPELFVVQTSFPPDDRSVGWERGTSISKEWDQATTESAIETAGYVSRHLEELSGVKLDSADRDPRLRDFARRFVERAFRRPITDEERDLYVNKQFEISGDPVLAIKRVVLLTLKSPRFLYRELGSSGMLPVEAENVKPDAASPVNPFDVASRMSFAMWDSIPDQTLLEAAAKGELTTREQVVRQGERMLADPRSTSKLREFFLQWLKVDHVPDVSKDSERFPEFNAAVANDLRSSLELFIDEVITSDSADFRQLLVADSMYLNGRLAKFYGADLPEAAPFEKISLDQGERAGVLSHPYLMAGFAYTATSSPIHRGVFIARSVLGRSLRPPPEAVAPLSPKLHADLTTRERVALQTKPEACQTCHAMINPLGFTLEQFDAVGRFRKEENGKPVNATGTYRTRTGKTVKFEGVRELATFLAGSDETHTAFVEQLFHSMIKQPIRAHGPQTLSTLRTRFVQENFNIRRLMVEIIATAALTSNEPNRQTSVTVSDSRN